MIDPNRLFADAMARMGTGAFAEAAALLRQVLTVLPGHPQVIAALGNAELGGGHIDVAIGLYRQALAQPGAQPDVWCNLARALRQAARPAEALSAVDRSLQLAPDLAEAWSCRGNILWDLERFADAVTAYDRAALLRPQDPRMAFNLANALRKIDRDDLALAAFRQALALAPDYVDALKNYALTLLDWRHFDEALAAIIRALALVPHETSLIDIHGQVLHALGRYEEAIDVLTREIALAPAAPSGYCTRGVSYHAAGKLDAALADFEQALVCDPAHVDSLVNRGTLLKDMGRLDEVDENYRRALAIAPDNAEANWSAGLLALMRGDYETGWPAYDWRWKSRARSCDYLKTAKPQWRGEDLTGKTIYLWREQGFGDYLQFCRYIPLVAARGGRVLVDVPDRLKPLIRQMPGDFTIVESEPADFDYQCPLMSLPAAFGTTLTTIPAAPYLRAAPERIAAFDQRLGPRPRAGLVWASNLAYLQGRDRHLVPEQLEPLFDLPFAFHVLQKEFSPAHTAWLEKFPHLAVHADGQNDFHDAAALIMAMDVVVTVDTAVAHLAGGLGKPVFVLLPYIADWRWLTGRSDSPWYPSMRLFRQPSRGDWAGAVAAVRQALAAWPA